MLLRDSVYKSIRQAILSREFQPGQDLREQTLVERFQVSRSPIRDALLRLEQENLVTVLPRQGYRVNAISMSDVEDILGLRRLVEPACAAVVAARADETALRTLDHFRGPIPPNFLDSGYLAFNRSFHYALANLSGNNRMAALVSDTIEHFDRLTPHAQGMAEYDAVDRHRAEHAAIIDAIQARDAARASRLSIEHVEGVHHRTIAALRDTAQQPRPE